MKNNFINTVKEENRHTDNLEDLHDRNKLADECYESVKETLADLYRRQLYLDLNCNGQGTFTVNVWDSSCMTH